jgi:hypothetical protein
MQPRTRGTVESMGKRQVRMRYRSSLTAVLATAGIIACAGSALAAHKPKHHRAAAAAPQQQIACTVIGCMPIPAACNPVAGKTLGGRPTGFDVIVCPPGVWPLK